MTTLSIKTVFAALLAGGAPGLHFYSMNQAAATTALWQRLVKPA